MKRRNTVMRIFAVLLASLVILPHIWISNVAATPATRARLAELEEQRRDAYAAVTQQQLLLDEVRGEMEVILGEMRALDMQLAEILEKLENAEHAFLEMEVRIADAEYELILAIEDRDRQYETLRSRLRVMHENGPISWLDVLLRSESINDFLMRFELHRTITQFDQEMFMRLEEATERIETNVNLLNRSNTLVWELARNFEAQQAELDRVMEQRAAWFEELAANEETQQILAEILEEEYRALDYQFGIVRARFVAEEAEIERQRRIAEENRRRAEAQERERQRQAEINARFVFDGFFQWPLPARTPADISSGFGPRTNPITRRSENHSGIDIPAPSGSRINAAADGVVRFAGWSGNWGNMVMIDHGSGYTTLYAHNSRNRVVVGQEVTRGQHIADVGTTGQSTGNHLHFEVRRNNVPIDPMQFFRR